MQWFEKDYFSNAEASNKLIQSGAVSHSFHGMPWMTYLKMRDSVKNTRSCVRSCVPQSLVNVVNIFHALRNLGWQMRRRGRERSQWEKMREISNCKNNAQRPTQRLVIAAALISRNKREILRFNKTELFYLWDLKLKTIAISGILNRNHWERFNWSFTKIFKDERLLSSDVISVVGAVKQLGMTLDC